MNTIENAVQWAIDIANNNSHGYSQANRWGPDYDCSSLVISAWQQAGVPVRDRGATFTGNMYNAFTSCGFVDVTGEVNLSNCAGMQRGDVLLNRANHTAMFIGSGQLVHARSSEGNSLQGDQSGNEVRTQAYYNYPWDVVLRYGGGVTTPAELKPDKLMNDIMYAIVCLAPEMREGDAGYYVQILQMLLTLKGYAPENTIKAGGIADGEFGDGTKEAVNRFKAAINLPQNGVCDPQTLSALFNRSSEVT